MCVSVCDELIIEGAGKVMREGDEGRCEGVAGKV